MISQIIKSIIKRNEPATITAFDTSVMKGRVGLHQIDYNLHMNNAKYLTVLEKALSCPIVPRRSKTQTTNKSSPYYFFNIICCYFNCYRFCPFIWNISRKYAIDIDLDKD